MLIEFLPLLILGFGLGFMHALDADHVMAVSMLANQRPSFARTLQHSLHWALGHGAVLIAAGVLLFGFGMLIPESLQKVAEASVGVLLIALGLLCFYQFRQDDLRLNMHRHGEIVHAHWHRRAHAHNTGHSHHLPSQHQPVLIGALHGLAGSAPALALIPAVSSGQFMLASLYLCLFSVGVMLSMLCFGLGFGVLQRWLKQRSQRLFRASRQLLASLSVLLGSVWLWQAV